MACVAIAQISVQGIPAIQDGFGGGRNEVVLAVSNPGNKPATENLSYRVYQLSSAVAAPIADAKQWRVVDLPSGETRLEKLAIDIPEVRAATAFKVDLLDTAHGTIGNVIVRALPKEPLGTIHQQVGGLVQLITTDETFAEALRVQGLQFERLDAAPSASSSARLLIVDRLHGIKNSGTQLPGGMTGLVIVVSKAPEDQLDRLTISRSVQGVRAEVAISSTAANANSASFLYRLLEVVRLATKKE